MKATCHICPHHCHIMPDELGLCGARKNAHGEVICDSYGKLTAAAMDPIEKKPLSRFYPGSMILSVGSYGCNLTCGFCQNSHISFSNGQEAHITASPESLIQQALLLKDKGNIGIAYTYNEPIIGYEFVYDCAKLAHDRSLKNVLVSNGYIEEKPLEEILPFIDAMNIDLKAFTEGFYQKIGGDLETVKRSIEAASKRTHVEVTTLIIPGENDSEAEMLELSSWLAQIDSNIPLHISRFFPHHLYADKVSTPVKTISRLSEIARSSLRYVYPGNC